MTAARDEPHLAAPGGLLLRRARCDDRGLVMRLQRDAYAPNRVLLGVEPLPLQADYDVVFQTMEVWLADMEGEVLGVIVLEPHADHLLVWSIATRPGAQSQGVGNKMLGAADVRARQLGLDTIRLYTGSTLNHLVSWYQRRGFALERVEQLADRSIAHLVKHLGETTDGSSGGLGPGKA